MTKEQAARRAVDGGAVMVQAITDYGPNSPQAGDAIERAFDLTVAAERLGCTRADFEAARH